LMLAFKLLANIELTNNLTDSVFFKSTATCKAEQESQLAPISNSFLILAFSVLSNINTSDTFTQR